MGMKGKHVLLVAGISCMLTGGVVQAAEESYALDEFVVTATKLKEVPEKVPASVSVVTAKEIQDRHVMSVAQALGQLPGVYLSPVADGGITLRGYGSADILVMVDGQPVNSGWNGAVDWSMIPVDRIDRIEVVRGAGSSLYGGRAVGGVIQITTKKAADGFHGSSLVSYGSKDTWKQDYTASIKKNKWDVEVGYEKRKTDGWRGYYIDKSTTNKPGSDPIVSATPNESARGRYILGGRGEKAFDTESYHIKTTYHFNDDQSLSYSFFHTDYSYVYNNPFSLIKDSEGNEIFNGTILLPNKKYIKFTPSDFLGYVGEKEWDVHNFDYDDEKNMFHARFDITDIKKDGYSSTSKATGQMTADELNRWNGAGTQSFYPSKTYDVDIHKGWTLGDHTLLAGIAYRQESFDQTRYNLTQWRNHDGTKEAYEMHGGNGETWAGYVQDKWQATEKLAVYAGLRFDRYKKYNGYGAYFDKKNGDLHNTFAEETYTEWSPKLALEYSLPADTVVYASYGHSFAPPLLYNVYRDERSEPVYVDGQLTVGDRPSIANPGIKPETTDTYEVGIRKKWGDHTSANVSLYQAKTKDTVSYWSTNEPTLYNGILYTEGFSQYRNRGDGKRKGVEVELKHRFNELTSGYLNYAWENATVDDEHDYNVPKHILHFGMEWTPRERWDILADAQYISPRQAPDETTGKYYAEDGFFIANLSLNYAVNPQTKVQFYVYNLFNKEFYASEAASERTYNVSVRYTF